MHKGFILPSQKDTKNFQTHHPHGHWKQADKARENSNNKQTTKTATTTMVQQGLLDAYINPIKLWRIIFSEQDDQTDTSPLILQQSSKAFFPHPSLTYLLCLCFPGIVDKPAPQLLGIPDRSKHRRENTPTNKLPLELKDNSENGWGDIAAALLGL